LTQLRCTTRSRERVIGAAELDHGLSDPGELMRRRQVPAEQLDEPVDVTVNDREPFRCVPRGEAREPGVHVAQQRRPVHRHVSRVGALGGLAPVHDQTLLAQRVRVRDRVQFEEAEERILFVSRGRFRAIYGPVVRGLGCCRVYPTSSSSLKDGSP